MLTHGTEETAEYCQKEINEDQQLLLLKAGPYLE